MSRITLVLLTTLGALTLFTACDPESGGDVQVRGLAGADDRKPPPECDILEQTCEADEKCVLAPDDDGAYSLHSTLCVPVDDFAGSVGAECKILDGITDTCDTGLMCVADPARGVGTCQPLVLAPLSLSCSDVSAGTYLVQDGHLIICGISVGPKG